MRHIKSAPNVRWLLRPHKNRPLANALPGANYTSGTSRRTISSHSKQFLLPVPGPRVLLASAWRTTQYAVAWPESRFRKRGKVPMEPIYVLRGRRVSTHGEKVLNKSCRALVESKRNHRIPKVGPASVTWVECGELYDGGVFEWESRRSLLWRVIRCIR